MRTNTKAYEEHPLNPREPVSLQSPEPVAEDASKVVEIFPEDSEPPNPEIFNICEKGYFEDLEEFEDRNSFPTRAFPNKAARFIRATSEARMIPESMVGAGILGITSAAIGPGLRVVNHLGTLPANAYIIVAAQTGMGKDLALGPVIEPLREIERELEAEFFKEAAALKAKRIEIERRLREKGKNTPTASEIEELTLNLAEVERELTKRPQLIVNDATTEALAEIMAVQPGESIASITSEGRGPMSIILGKYRSSNSSNQSANDLDFFAGAFSGSPRVVNRKGKGPTSETYRLDRPCLAILWFIQPEALREALAKPETTESGFLCRPLFFDSFAEPPIYSSEIPKIPRELTEWWHSLIRQLVESYRSDRINEITLDPEAAKVLLEFSNEINRKRSSGGPLRDVNGIAARWGENAYRVALILHAIEYGEHSHERTISVETAKAAISLVHWFALETLSMLSESRAKAHGARETRLITLLKEAGGEKPIHDLKNNNGFEDGEVEAIAARSQRISIKKEKREGPGRPSLGVAHLTEGKKDYGW